MKNKLAKKIVSVLLVMTFAGASLLGCGSVTTESVNSGSSETDKFPYFVQVNDAGEDAPDVYAVTRVNDSKYWTVLNNGVVDGAKVAGVNLYKADFETDLDGATQLYLLEKLLPDDADGLILAADNSEILKDSVERIRKNGTAVVLVDNMVNTDYYDVVYMTDNLLAGRIAANQLLSMMKEDGVNENENITVAIEIGVLNSQTINERLAGFLEYWTIEAPSNWEVVKYVRHNGNDSKEAVDIGRYYIESEPNLRAFFATNNSSTEGLATALKESGRDDIYIVGFDYSDQIKELVEDSHYRAATLIQKQYDMGYKSVLAAKSVAGGNTYQEKFSDTGVLTVTNDNYKDDAVVKVLSN